MFGIIWQPAVAAATVILENANEASVVKRALDALLLAAKMAAYHQVRREGGREGWECGGGDAGRWVREGTASGSQDGGASQGIKRRMHCALAGLKTAVNSSRFRWRECPKQGWLQAVDG